MSLATRGSSPDYALGLTIGRSAAQVRVSGDIDIAAAADLSKLMTSLDLLAYMAVEVDMSEVTFLDSFGIRPLVEATRRRRIGQLPPVVIGECSASTLRFLELAGIDGRPHLDVSAWDSGIQSGFDSALPILKSQAEQRHL